MKLLEDTLATRICAVNGQDIEATTLEAGTEYERHSQGVRDDGPFEILIVYGELYRVSKNPPI